MPITRVLGSESALNSTRSAIVRPCPNQARPHANLPAPRVPRPLTPRFSVQQIRRRETQNSAAAGSPAPNRADELVEFASPRSALAPHAHASADSRNSYAHGAADHVPSHPYIPSATAPEPPPAATGRARRSHFVPPRSTSSALAEPLRSVLGVRCVLSKLTAEACNTPLATVANTCG